MIKIRWGLGVMGAVALGVIGILGLSASGRSAVARVVFVEPEPTPAWAQRIALVDEALGRSELSRAIYEWREAYGVALRTRRSEPLIAVGDRALRIAELAGGSGQFLAEAKDVYLHAARRASAEGSRHTILGIAALFERLGDTQQAELVRRIAGGLS
jgi:hypothetical protein